MLLRIHEIEPSDARAIEKLVELYRSEGDVVAAAGFMEVLLPLQPPSAAGMRARPMRWPSWRSSNCSRPS